MEEQIVDWDLLEAQHKNRKNFKKSKSELVAMGYDAHYVDMVFESLDGLKPTPVKDQLIEGVIRHVYDNIAIVDIGCREDAYIEIEKEAKEYRDYIQSGVEITAKVIGDPEEKGHISVSFSDAVKASKEKEIIESIGKSIAYKGQIIELVQGGYKVVIDEIETFMPGSLAGINKLHDFEVLLGQSLLVMPVNFERGNIVVSHREYLQTLIPGKIEELQDNLQTKISGTVTGSTKYGVFCEFNDCLTGLILASDLTDDWKEKYDSRKIKPGDVIEFYVKEIVSNKKIILSQELKYDPWHDIESRYKIPCEVKGKIKSIKPYGAFIEVEEGLTGLLHESEYEGIELEIGNDITITINKIEKSTKKLFLNL